jgi:hypothetical protein
MPWGQHKGAPLSAIPESYLLWVAYEAGATRPWLKQAIQSELDRRNQQDHPPPVDLRGTIKTWYAEMSLRFHPDRGGNHQAMVAINESHQRLLELTGLK